MLTKIILFIILIFLIASLIIILGGYILYKSDRTDSWDSGSFIVYKKVCCLFRKIFELFKKIGRMIWKFLSWFLPILGIWFYEEATGKSISIKPEEQIDTRLGLVESEVDQLVNEFEGRPYIAPILGDQFGVRDGIIWIHIKAVGLASKYVDSSSDTLRKLIKNIVKQFYQRCRHIINVGVYVTVFTSSEAIIAIPLTPKANGELYQKEQNNHVGMGVSTAKGLTETVPSESEENMEDESASWL